MFRLLSSLISFLMYWMFLYVGSFLLMIVAIVYITQTNKTSTIQSFTNIIQHFKWLTTKESSDRGRNLHTT